MAPEVMTALRESGVPLKNFGFYARPVDRADDDSVIALASLNAEQTFLLASTTKVVTSLAALDLLGPSYSWPLHARTTGLIVNGQLRGDLVIAGNRHTVTASELKQWFQQMRAEGLQGITGQMLLEGVSLVPEDDAADTTAALEASDARRAESQRVRPEAERDDGSMVLSIEPGSGDRAKLTLTPKPIGVVVVNEVLMGGPCDAWARWSNPSDRVDGTPHLWVRGRGDASCPREPVAYVRPLPGMKYAPDVVLPASDRTSAPKPATPVARTVAALWAETGGTLRGRVIETETDDRPAPTDAAGRKATWSSTYSIPLAQVVREINKTSDNVAARSLLLSLSGGDAAPENQARQSAKLRVHQWLRAQGLVDGDIRVDVGSGQSREERGKPRAMVQLLCNAWRAEGAQAFVNSLPIAGVDGTLIHRMRNGLATGQAFLKTGTLSDTRALAGYVRGRSGVVYAVTAIVNHPDAARARSALDVFIGWVVKHG
jgi:D-alanyl-D-alanine carboxypeptidase/D-alanyl-D-alanine-endopeptidase (penicillin-binding protein 4)